MAELDIQDAPEIDEQQAPPQDGPGPKTPVLKNEDKQKLAQIITKMQSAGESDDNIRAVVKRFQEMNMQTSSPIDKGIKEGSQNLNQPLQFNGTFKPDLEGEKNGWYLNDKEYQAQKADFVKRIVTDDKGRLLYPEQDPKSGQWMNHYTKEPLPNFDPKQMQGGILQVPDKYLKATNGQKFISPVYDKGTNSYRFPGVQTPDVPKIQTLPAATVYGSKEHHIDNSLYDNASTEVKKIMDESDKEGGQFRQVLKNHPELSQDIDNTLKTYGDQYKESLSTGSDAMSNIIQKTIEDKFDLNKPLPNNLDPNILNGHLNVLNNLEKNKNNFESIQQDLQHQADLLTDRAKRTGQPVSQEDADRLAQKSAQNIQNWNNYIKSVQFAQNYVQQPAAKEYLDAFQKRQSGLQLLDEVRQRSFPSQVASKMKQDEYDRKAIEGNLNAWDYVKTFMGKAASGLSNMGETVIKATPLALSGGLIGLSEKGNAAIEGLNNSTQQFLSANLPAISPEAIEQMDKHKHGWWHLINDVASVAGGFAPYVLPGLAEAGWGQKATTFATALAENLPIVRKEAEKAGLTGSAYNTYLTLKPLVNAAFMSLLPNAKFAKGFDKDVAESIVNGEFNNPKRFLINLASKALKDPNDIAHLQAMLSGTELGNAVVNQVTNGLQAKEDIERGIGRKEGLPVELSNIFNPRQTVVMALAGKLLETIPTLKNIIGDYREGKDVAETYDHIQNNLIELAGHNLEGVSKKVEEMVKKDPGNIYAQHLKHTLEDYAYAEARMPEGLQPEQKAALFDIQKQISQKQRQMGYSDPIYQPHIQKNIDELNKQIPDIIKDPKKANDYLKDSHKELAENILSPKIEENEKTKGNAQAQGGQISEHAIEGESKPHSSPSFLESRHADTVDDEVGKVSGPNNNPLSSEGRKDANDLAEEVKDKGVTKIITSGLERARQTGEVVAKKTGATIESKPSLNTWDIGDFDKSTDEEFKKAQEFFVKNPDEKEFEGKKINESFNQYKDRIIKARTELQNEPNTTLVVNHSNNMMLWDAYVKNGHTWNEQAQNDYLSSKTPEPATLVKSPKPHISVSTPNIVNVKLKTQENALQERSPEEILQREQEEAGSTGSERGRMESIQQRERPSGKSEPLRESEKDGEDKSEKEIKSPDDELPFTEESGDKSILATNEGSKETISIKRSVNDVLRQRMGLPDVPIPKLGSDSEEMGKAKARIDGGKSNPLNIVDKIINTEDVNDIGLSTNDRFDMQYHMLQLKQKGIELNKSMNEVREKLSEDPENKKEQEKFILLTQQRAQHGDDYIRAATANRIGSAVWGKSGNAMQVEMEENGIVLQRMQRIADWYGGKLPDEVKAKLDEIQKQLDESSAKLQKLQEKYDKKVLENEALKAMKGGVQKNKRKTSEEFKEERKQIIGDIKDALKKSRGELGVNIVPGAKELAAISPHLLKLFKSYAEEGLNKLDTVIDKMFDDVKEHVPGITKNDIQDILAGTYKETKKLIEKNQEYVKAQQAKANAMLMLRKVEQRAMNSRKNLYMKALDFATQWERRAIFAFNNAVFVKLSSAALLGSSLHKPIEFGVGKIAAKAFPKLAENAIIEGNENLESLGKFYSELFNPKKFAEQTWQIYKKGESGLTQELSQKGHVGYTYDKWYHYASPVLDAYTNTHQVIKDPIKRAVFESSMQNALQWYRKNGMDPTHPLILEEARQYAYKRAEIEIFQGSNTISSKINSLIGQLEEGGIKQARETGLHNKISGNLKYTGSTLYHMLVPIATVPINITRAASVGAMLPYNIIKAYNLENGVKELNPEQSDIVLRQLKKGMIGAAYWSLGLFIYGNAGGLWNKYDPDKKKSGTHEKNLKPNRPHSDELITPMGNIPKEVQHTPQLQALQYGATMANTYVHYKDELGESTIKALGAGAMAQLSAMIDGVPPAKETAKVIEGLNDPAQLKKVGEDLKRGFGINKMQDAGILPPDSPKPSGSRHQRQPRN